MTQLLKLCLNSGVLGAEFYLCNLEPHYTSDQSHSLKLHFRPLLRPVLIIVVFSILCVCMCVFYEAVGKLQT